MESYCRSQQKQMPKRNSVSAARFDQFWSQCHSKRAAGLTHPPPPLHPLQIRTHSQSNPTSSLVLFTNFCKQLTCSIKLVATFYLPSGKLTGEGAARRRILGAGRLKGRRIQAQEMPRRRDGPGKQGFAGPSQIPTTLFPVFSQLTPSPRTRVYAVRSTHPLFGVHLAPRGRKLPADPVGVRPPPLLTRPKTAPLLLAPTLHPLPPQYMRTPPSQPNSPLPLHTAPEQLLHPCNRSRKCLPHLHPQPPATVPVPTDPQSQARRCSVPRAGDVSPGRGAKAAVEVRGAQRHLGVGAGGRAPASLGRDALPCGPFCARRGLRSLSFQRRPPGIPGRAPPFALRSAPFHLDFCRRGNFGFGDDLRSYWLPAGGVGGHGCSSYSAPRRAAQRLVSSQQVPSASPGVTCAPGGPWGRLLMQIDQRRGAGGGEWAGRVGQAGGGAGRGGALQVATWLGVRPRPCPTAMPPYPFASGEQPAPVPGQPRRA